MHSEENEVTSQPPDPKPPSWGETIQNRFQMALGAQQQAWAQVAMLEERLRDTRKAASEADGAVSAFGELAQIAAQRGEIVVPKGGSHANG